MKTSNKLILTAFLIAVCALVFHDTKLKAVYLSKSYLDPLRGFAALPGFTGFTTVDVNASGMANVKIVQGPFNVMIRGNEDNCIRITQEGTHLKINVIIPPNTTMHERNYGASKVFISCPTLSVLNFNNKYLLNNKQITDSAAYEAYSRQNIIHGFILDSLAINEDNGSYVVLDSNTIGLLKATTGASAGSAPIIDLNKNNKIAAARLNIQNKSDLHLNCIIPILACTLGDNASLFTTGSVSNQMMKR